VTLVNEPYGVGVLETMDAPGPSNAPTTARPATGPVVLPTEEVRRIVNEVATILQEMPSANLLASSSSSFSLSTDTNPGN